MSASTLQRRNWLDLLATVVTWVFWFAVLAAVLRVILALLGQAPLFGAHIGGPISSPSGLCLNAAEGLLEHAGSGLSHPGLSQGVRASWSTASVCAAHPTGQQALANTITLLPTELLRLGALYLAMRLTRAAARDGVYTAEAARLLLVLGWWLLVGGMVATVTEALARMNLLSQLVTWHVDWGQWPVAWSVSWPVAWIGLGLIVFARVMRIGAGMRADLQGTV
ncbi:MAG TPA: hypothetical protein VMA72_01090 [Streptosporangiaceae bacterium]|nr:hypothetical protein [Streptosporangiaceae bacterium]